MVAATSAKAANRAAVTRRGKRPAEQRIASEPDHRSRHGFAIGHPAAGYRRHALRRVWAAAGLHHVYAVEPVSRRAGSGASIQDDPGRFEVHLRQIKDWRTKHQ